ncbi:DUF6612 family protein [Amedibacillus sp. YH-ame10]
MKKLTSLLFCIAMLFSLTACGSKVSDDALDAFEAVIQNMAKMKSADYVLTMDATNKEGDQKMTLEGSYNLQNAKPLLSASLSMEMDNEKQEDAIQFYIDGDYMYLNLMEFMKQKQSLAGMLPTEELPSLDTAADTFKLPKDELKKYLKEASLKGDTLTMVFDCEKIMDVSKESGSSTSQLSANTTINKLNLVMELKDNAMKKTTISMDITQTVAGEKETTSADIDIEFKNINKATPIQFPDFTDYIETESSLLAGFM